MSKYKFHKRQIKSLIKFANNIKFNLESMNTGFTGWLLDDAAAEIRQNIIATASAIPERYNPKCEIKHFNPGDFYTPGMPFGRIIIHKNKLAVELTVTDNMVDVQPV
jgi:hypothetical protein